MKLAGTYSLETTPDRAYALLQDSDVLARCIPGCDKLTRTDDGVYEMHMKLLIASISGSFNGKVSLSGHEPPHRFRMDVDGSGKIGFMKGAGLIALEPGRDHRCVL
jgi:carbon monoxide dehydrogenase subunit G